MQACFTLFSAQHFCLRENALNRSYMHLIDPLLTYFTFTFKKQTLCPYTYVQQPERFFKVVHVRIQKASGRLPWVGTFRWPLVHGLPQWTWSMDYLNGLPVDYPKWTILKSVVNINLTKLEPEQKMQSINKYNYRTLPLTMNRFNTQLDLCHKILQPK